MNIKLFNTVCYSTRNRSTLTRYLKDKALKSHGKWLETCEDKVATNTCGPNNLWGKGGPKNLWGKGGYKYMWPKQYEEKVATNTYGQKYSEENVATYTYSPPPPPPPNKDGDTLMEG